MKLTKENYVDCADQVMRSMNQEAENGRRSPKLTTSKIRNLLAMTADLYNDAKHYSGNKLDGDMISRIQYLKMHFAYEAGREKAVKNLMIKADIMRIIDQIGSDKDQLILFCHYMEALVAYHRYYGGQD